jgi:hypothetical protein
MKTPVLIAALICIGAIPNYAQYDQDYFREYKQFKVGLGMGYAVPLAGDGAGAGLLAYLEPAYRATDHVLVGLRLEWAFIVRGVLSVKDRDVSGDVSSVGSYTLNSVYYFNNNEFRPFVGAGVGFFRLSDIRFDVITNDPRIRTIGTETRFGFYPRVGVDIGHFNAAIDYNIIPPTDVPDGGEVKNNYLGLRVGVSIGGGKTRNRRRL